MLCQYWITEWKQFISRYLRAKSGVIKATRSSKWPSWGLASGTPDLSMLPEAVNRRPEAANPLTVAKHADVYDSQQQSQLTAFRTTALVSLVQKRSE